MFSAKKLEVSRRRDLRHRRYYAAAGGAQCAFLQVDPLHRVGWGHGAAVILAVSQVQSVAEFMNRFLDYPLAEQFWVGRKAIELLAQPVR